MSVSLDSILMQDGGSLAARPYINTNREHPNFGKVVRLVANGKNADGSIKFNEKVVANASQALRDDEWVQYDTALTAAKQKTLVIVQDLISSGLVHNAGTIGNLVSNWDAVSKMDEGSITLDGVSNEDLDNVEFSSQGVVLPILQKGFKLSARALDASRKSGSALDTAHITAATQVVSTMAERLVFRGKNFNVRDARGNSRTIYGLLNHPNRATTTFGNWLAPGYTQEQILKDIQNSIRIVQVTQRSRGKLRVYLNPAYEHLFREDYKQYSERTLLDRVLGIDVIDAVRFADECPVGSLVVVEWDVNTIDLAMIEDINTIQLPSTGPWSERFQVYGVMAPRIKADFDGYLGLLVASIA